MYTNGMAKNIHITKAQARRFLIRYHGLDGSEKWEGNAGILACFERLGAIQYDPLDVAGRNPDLVLQSRVKGYRRNQIHELLYEKRQLVDHWDKQMSIHLASEWPHRTRIRAAYAEILRQWLKRYRNSEDALIHVDAVREALDQTGPTLPGKLDFGSLPNTSGWGSCKVAGTVLEYLAAVGEAGIHSRRNTQKVYELIHKLLPEKLLKKPEPFADEHEFLLWYTLRRVEAVGLAANRNGGTWLVSLLDSTRTRAPLLEELVKRKRLRKVTVEGSREQFYMPTAGEHFLDVEKIQEPEVRFLAPLPITHSAVRWAAFLLS